jgi:hypothetical protein
MPRSSLSPILTTWRNSRVGSVKCSMLEDSTTGVTSARMDPSETSARIVSYVLHRVVARARTSLGVSSKRKRNT